MTKILEHSSKAKLCKRKVHKQLNTAEAFIKDNIGRPKISEFRTAFAGMGLTAAKGAQREVQARNREEFLESRRVNDL